MMLACQFGQLHNQIDHMNKQIRFLEKDVSHEKADEGKLSTKMKGLDKKIDKIEKQEQKLLK